MKNYYEQLFSLIKHKNEMLNELLMISTQALSVLSQREFDVVSRLVDSNKEIMTHLDMDNEEISRLLIQMPPERQTDAKQLLKGFFLERAGELENNITKCALQEKKNIVRLKSVHEILLQNLQVHYSEAESKLKNVQMEEKLARYKRY